MTVKCPKCGAVTVVEDNERMPQCTAILAEYPAHGERLICAARMVREA